MSKLPSKPSDHVVEKAGRKLLKFLSSCGPSILASFDDGHTTRSLLTSLSGKKLVTIPFLLDQFHRAGLLDISENQITLSKLGKNKLRRQSGDIADQHRQIINETTTVDGEKQQVRVNTNESPLTRLRHRKTISGGTWLDDDHVEAGERLRKDFTIGQFVQSVSSNWDGAIGATKSGRGGKADLADSAIDARERLEKALQVVGPDLAGVLSDVCCFLKGLELVERERRWPPRSAKLMLRTGLDLLTRHYGLRTWP